MPAYQRWLVLAIVSTALLLIAIDMTVLYIALPQLTHDLSASASAKLWIINIYPLMASGLLMGAGTLGDRFGHKRVFISGLALFGLASGCAAYSSSPGMLIASRAWLAIGAALMMPATLSIIRLTFEEEHERSVAIGVWTAVASGGAAVGPLVGGLLLEYFWWGSVFLIHVPIVLLALVLARWFVPTAKAHAPLPYDWPGALQIMVVLFALAYALQELSKSAPTYEAVLLTGVLGATFLVFFIRRQKRIAHPLIDWTLLRSRTFSSALLAGLVTSAALAGVDFVLSQRLQLVMGLSPFQAALFFLPLSIGALLISPLSGWGRSQIGSARFLILALVVDATSAAAFLASNTASISLQLLCLFILGAGIGATLTATASTLMENVPPERAGMAASLEEVSFELGSALGITFLGSLMSAVYTRSLTLPPHTVGSETARESIDQTLRVAQSLSPHARAALVGLAHTAFDSAFVAVMAAITLLLLATTLIVWLNFRRR